MADEPTIGEITRRLDVVAARLESTVNKFERIYVPRGEWDQARRADDIRTSAVEERVEKLEDAHEGDSSFRRTMFAMFAVAAFSGVLSFAVALTFFILGK